MSRRLRYFHEQVSGAEIPMAGAIVDVGTDLDEMEVCFLVALSQWLANSLVYTCYKRRHVLLHCLNKVQKRAAAQNAQSWTFHAPNTF
jgi:hypothetical protein